MNALFPKNPTIKGYMAVRKGINHKKRITETPRFAFPGHSRTVENWIFNPSSMSISLGEE